MSQINRIREEIERAVAAAFPGVEITFGMGGKHPNVTVDLAVAEVVRLPHAMSPRVDAVQCAKNTLQQLRRARRRGPRTA